MSLNMAKVRRRDLTSSFAALAAKCEEQRNLNCEFGDEREQQDKDRILPRFLLAGFLDLTYTVATGYV